MAKALRDDRPRAQHTVRTRTGVVLGTPEYMAPELIMGQSYDGRADQYALAVTVYEILSGRRPFDGATGAAILVQQTTQRPPRLDEVLPSLASALAQAVDTALAKDPGQRYLNCQSFAADVAAAVAAPCKNSVAPAAERPSGLRVFVDHVRRVLLGDDAAAGRADTPRPAPEEGPGSVYVPLASQSTSQAQENAKIDPIVCPVCGKRFKVPRGAYGRSFRCTECRELLRVPDVGEGAEQTKTEGGAETPRGYSRSADTPPSQTRGGSQGVKAFAGPDHSHMLAAIRSATGHLVLAAFLTTAADLARFGSGLEHTIRLAASLLLLRSGFLLAVPELGTRRRALVAVRYVAGAGAVLQIFLLLGAATAGLPPALASVFRVANTATEPIGVLTLVLLVYLFQTVAAHLGRQNLSRTLRYITFAFAALLLLICWVRLLGILVIFVNSVEARRLQDALDVNRILGFLVGRVFGVATTIWYVVVLVRLRSSINKALKQT